MTILCAIDKTRRAERVAAVARRLAAAVDDSMVLVHVFDPMKVPTPPTRELSRTVTTERLEAYWREHAHDVLKGFAAIGGDESESTVLAEGDPVSELVRLVPANDVGLVVVGSAARKPLDRIMKGSMAADLVREMPCPVAVVTDDAELPDDGPVLAAYDGSDHSLRAARHAARLAAALRQDLVLMEVAAPDDPAVGSDEDLARELHAAARSCEAAAAGLAERRLDVTVAVEHGDPVERILHAAGDRGASLIVIGNRGRNAVASAILGSVSAGVIRGTDRVVVVAGPRSEQTAG